MRTAVTMSIAIHTDIASMMAAAVAVAVAAATVRRSVITTGTTAIAAPAMVGMDGAR